MTDTNTPTLPLIIQFGYTNYVTISNSTYCEACCSYCKDKNVIRDKFGTTSNFVRHLKQVHAIRSVH